MLPRIKTLFKPTTISFLLVYVLIRFFSFFTYEHFVGNQIIAGISIIVFGYICIKNLKLGWLLLVAELLLDGAGHFFELDNLLLRTWFLGIFGLVWLITKIKKRDFKIALPRSIVISIVGIGVMVAWSILNGFIHNHSATIIAQDAILFCFLFLIFPALKYWHDTEQLFLPIIKAWIFGSAIFSLITFFMYASGIGRLPDLYYHWFRNIAAGKITDLGNQFFRIVLPEHLFIVPIILVLVAFLIHNYKNKKIWILLLCSLVILTLNFSRIYFIGLLVGMIVLGFKQRIKQWLAVSTITVFSILIIFSSLQLLASRGQSFGLELLGLRLGGTTAPQTDPSGAIRLAILPDILRQIKNKPLFGSGLGATVIYADPNTQEQITRSQFDWGYFEMITELGIVGTIVFLSFFFLILFYLARMAYSFPAESDTNLPLTQGLLVGAVALCVINITTPALFHGFGILYMVLILVLTQKNKKETSSA